MENKMKHEEKADLDWKGPSDWPEGDMGNFSAAAPAPPYQPNEQGSNLDPQGPQYPHPDEKASSSSSPFSSSTTPSHPTTSLQQPTTRTFDMNYKNWKMCGVHVTDTATNTIHYKASLHLRKPHITVTTAAAAADENDDAPVGAVTFHYTSFRIDTTVRGNALPLTPLKFCGRKGHTFVSRALHGRTLRWKCQRAGSDLVCVFVGEDGRDDDDAPPLARYRFSCFSVKKCGSMEVSFAADGAGAGAGAGDGAASLLEEVMVTGLGMIEWVYTMRMSAVGAAVVAG